MAGRMTIRNTSKYPSDEVRELVRFVAKQIDLRETCVNVKSTSGVRRGRAYWPPPAMSNAPRGARHLIVVGVDTPDCFPYEQGYWNATARDKGEARRGGRWPEVTLNDWREAIVFVTAHEAAHIEQYREGLPISEVRAEWFGAKVLGRWRNEVIKAMPTA